MTRTPQGGLRIHAGIWTALLTLLLTATPLTAFAAPGTNQGQGAAHRSARATAALQAATELFQPKAGEARLGGRARDLAGVTAADNATMVLRDLAVSVPDLDPAQQQVARRILARPTDTDPIDPSGVKYPSDPTLSGDTCTDPADVDHVCVHWVKDPSDPNAPAAVDENGNGVPDWVETTQQVFGDVWQHIVGDLGYRAPMSDLGTADPGIDGRTDIYLADLRPYNLYGYCVPEWVDGSSVRYPAYCVVDNDFQDYSAGPLASLEVTAAHEFFHAVQFGYDVDADTWVMEGTAAWMEDEVYDGINDNLQYLPWSPLHAPAAPLDLLDTGDHTNAWQYGSWIWWRFLGEYFGAGKAEDPAVVRQVWQRIGAGERSLQALNNVIRNHGASFGSLFATFGAVNHSPQQWYAEGASYAKYAAPAAGRFTLTTTRPGTPWLMTRLDHLSNATAVLRPGTGLSGAWRLRVVLDLPPTYRGSRATITVHRTDGRTPRFPVTLNSKGDGVLAVPFGKTSVAQVVLTVTNASTRISSCGSGRQWSCGGIPVDNRLPFSFRARAIR